jgi:ABC-type proline/glycine betaine transport system substrate-binding protein
MRIVLAATVFAASLAPALADQAAADRSIAIMYEEWAEATAANKARQTAIHALCLKVGTARVGLTAEGVRKSCWGKPSRINETLTGTHRHEQWVYGAGQYVYLTDGIVTAIQSSR